MLRVVYSRPVFLRQNAFLLRAQRGLLTEGRTEKPASREAADWPRYKNFTLANISKLNADIEETMFTRLQRHLDKTRSIFDKAFEKVFKKRIEGIGYWIIALSVVFVNLTGLNMQMKKNQQLRLQADDVLLFKQQLKTEIEQIKEDILKTKQILIEKNIPTD
ncbi:hypothetical protein RFI_06607 [Reticulomyxa filosa]|uniref:Uncharacterized protein n=1 Tax=Reticulomyxa filosa TaxID=46433 RepID=X6NZ09_RETFI|nr:hypothetical protein RFI_06607 [Reticulomyxa filosa]|eukprot:ETO30512.1 hypothetical protein RFI_06607 [Reticulomyxa filosa]